ncbi:MAG: hypothetical protein JW822_11080 [Spirochaetales bacterium]|nr:hypothetical protein [Spirochaetales bacterium]
MAFTNLFSLIEAGLYYPIIARDIENNTIQYMHYMKEFHNYNIENVFKVIIKKDYVWKAYYLNQTSDDIVKRKQAFDELAKIYPKQMFVRLIGPGGKKIHFSTLEGDINQPIAADKINYLDLNKADPSSSKFNILAEAGEKPKVILDNVANRFIYSFPVLDSVNDYLGTALFYIPVDNLKMFILNNLPGMVLKEVKIISDKGILFDPSGLLSYSGSLGLEELQAELENLWQDFMSADISSTTLATVLRNEEVRIFYVHSEFGYLGLIVPLSQFAMSTTHKIIILVIFFFTTFLIIFLIFNLKQDPQRIVAERMRKFQIEFLKEFIKNKEEIDLDHWQHEINTRRLEIKKYMKKGLAKLPENKEAQLDNYIMQSWDEVISFIKTKAVRPMMAQPELKRIEALIQSALAQGRIILPAGTLPAQPQQERIPQATAVAVEELIEAEDVEEIGEAVAVEEIEEVEAVEELAEAEAVEEIEEAEEIEEVEEIEEAEAVEEIEKVEEVEEAEAVEEIEEVEEVEEAEAVEEIETVRKAVPAITPLEPEPYEELEELPVSASKTREEQEEDQKLIQFKELISKEKIKCYTLKETIELFEQSSANVIFDQGVYRIKEELYNTAEKKIKHRGLRALAETILDTEKKKQDNEVIGIDHIIKIDESFSDFTTESDSKDTPVKTVFSSARKRMPFIDLGLDLDGYIKQFDTFADEKVSVHAFGDLLKKLKSVCAAVLNVEGNAYKVTLSIGINEESKSSFEFALDSVFVGNYLDKRQVIYLDKPIADINMFDGRLVALDMKYIKYAVFLPARYQDKKAYLFIGFSERHKKELVEILQTLNIYLIED